MLLGMLWCSPAAAADHARAQLSYQVAPELASCPDQAEFQRRVAQQLGYDPFLAQEGARVALELRANGRAVHGRLEVRASEQAAPATRELSDAQDSCDALVTALASTLALSLDPLAASSPHSVAPPAPPPPVALAPTLEPVPPAVAPAQPAPAPVAAPPATGEQAPRTSGFATLGAGVSLGLVPGVALFGAGSFGVRVRAFALELEGRADSSVKGDPADDRHVVEATAITGGLIPCMHRSVIAGCLTVRLGALQGRASGVSDPRLGSSFLGTVGVALRVELPARRGFRARIGLHGALPLVRTELLVNGQVAWTAPPVYGGLSLALHVPLW